jgi:ubiquinone/menaquinone biosynthesis C-methylase UbiE
VAGRCQAQAAAAAAPNATAVIAHDNLEEFQDPANYDLEEVPRSQARIAFHVALARRVGGPALELACGSGIVALPVAHTGVSVTGVDLAEPMLHHARAKARAQGLERRTRWLHGDAKAIRVPEGARHFAFVFITGNAFQAFLTPVHQAALLDTAQHHVRPGGTFCFETRQPSAHDLRDVSEEEHWGTFVDRQGQRVTVTGTQRYDAARAVLHWTTFRRWHDGVAPREHVTRIACRFTEESALDALLQRAGFEVVERYGDWDGSTLTARSEHIISVCRPA